MYLTAISRDSSFRNPLIFRLFDIQAAKTHMTRDGMVIFNFPLLTKAWKKRFHFFVQNWYRTWVFFGCRRDKRKSGFVGLREDKVVVFRIQRSRLTKYQPVSLTWHSIYVQWCKLWIFPPHFGRVIRRTVTTLNSSLTVQNRFVCESNCVKSARKF